MKPDNIKITPLPPSNEFEVPLGDREGSVIATCEPHYVPTLRSLIMFSAAAGVGRPELQELLDVHLSEHRVDELGDSESDEEESEPEEEEEEEEEEEPQADNPHGRTLEQVNDELDDLEEPEGPDLYEALKRYPWTYTNDWTDGGKSALRAWMVSQGMSDRGRVTPETQTKFALLHVGSGALSALLATKAHARFTRAVERASA
ncbi:hypothetical protein [Nonomuraea sp. NPDC049141]|uniref:hypothetical protein n=1 Tax=Nonomuraea sp. NPDC049141 TaxID=3155500 RepID=UPI0033F4FEDB